MGFVYRERRPLCLLAHVDKAVRTRMDNRAVEGISTKALTLIDQTTLVIILILPRRLIVNGFKGAIPFLNIANAALRRIFRIL